MKRVGVLALQGDFAAHRTALTRAGSQSVLIREPRELEGVQGLIIPGGESSTMLKLIEYEGLMEPLIRFAGQKPIFGTCAGAILIATEVVNPMQASLGLIDMQVERNGYGRQNESHIVEIEPSADFVRRTSKGDLEAVLIRAPIIKRTGEAAKVLLAYKGRPLLVEQGRHMAATFHPELTKDPRVHSLFLGKLGA